MAARSEVDREQSTADRQGGETCQATVTAGRDEYGGETRGADDTTCARELGRHLTITTARSEWPGVETVRT